MRRKEKIRVCELGLVANIANLIMCRLTGGAWLIVMLFESKVFRIMLKILFDLFLIYLTKGWWLLCIGLRIMIQPVIEDYIEDRQKHKKRRKRRS